MFFIFFLLYVSFLWLLFKPYKYFYKKQEKSKNLKLYSHL